MSPVKVHQKWSRKSVPKGYNGSSYCVSKRVPWHINNEERRRRPASREKGVRCGSTGSWKDFSRSQKPYLSRISFGEVRNHWRWTGQEVGKRHWRRSCLLQSRYRLALPLLVVSTFVFNVFQVTKFQISSAWWLRVDHDSSFVMRKKKCKSTWRQQLPRSAMQDNLQGMKQHPFPSGNMTTTVDGRITEQNAITSNTHGAVTLGNNSLRTRRRSPNLIICVRTGRRTLHWLAQLKRS